MSLVETQKDSAWENLTYEDLENNVFVFGKNTGHELGVHQQPVSEFTPLPNSTFSAPILKVRAGDKCTWFICEDGNLYHCGVNSALNTTTITPTQQGLEALQGYRVKDIEVGESHALILCTPNHDADRTVLFVCGNQRNYSCGLGTDSWFDLAPHPVVNDPTKFSTLSKIYSGYQSTALVTQDNKIYFAGKSKNGNLGVANIDSFVCQYTALENFKHSIQKVAIGFSHTILLTTAGDCYGMGMDDSQQLSLTDNREKHVPTKILTNVRIVDVAVGNNHSLFLSENQQLLTTGNNFHGESAHDRRKCRIVGPVNYAPDVETILQRVGAKIQSINCGAWHSIVTTTNDSLLVFGYNSCDQLLLPNSLKDKNDSSDTLQNLVLLDLPFVKRKLQSRRDMRLVTACGHQHTVLYFAKLTNIDSIMHFRRKLMVAQHNRLFTDITFV